MKYKTFKGQLGIRIAKAVANFQTATQSTDAERQRLADLLRSLAATLAPEQKQIQI